MAFWEQWRSYSCKTNLGLFLITIQAGREYFRIIEDEHIFVITLDNGSDTEGCFELVEENAAKCLGNSDNIKCCYVDAGVNATNFKQEAGRVRINGQTAEVLKPITITNKSATSNGH